ncbi:MAG: ABC transporter substrate-binding protein [Bifidobacterium tibiigranuli]|uniref:ABC transporter substrate-binding protein n=1 Tax=Bifidobacterium tibiigranuli TaxID=2172043 RepID=UPI002352027F|nr:ABC transporter substrate-binding protein [Bifidobacterium tibiigranuli]MCH3975012.1 ABC transporter substrate-binding protein [Bifidobacterium tibiigranuli]MCH4189233.1 ABC transporter substrate-binding protein [Bifidobacterium tibiigranuli]MCH4202772.1 ABC transporter substrate-binding protein [Bifidobacterium tibiigranuli]MCH4273789.1 ABC transporter substrate-binding protein [Bifidobacterium tibiigranuli]MCI1791715.1 ABC transporter substrate-binding protein [Bifidobacterium tibiigranul
MRKHVIIRRLAASVIAMGTLLSAAACGSGGGSGASNVAQDLVVARSLETTDMMPETAYSNGDIWAVQQVFESLTKNKADASGIEPGLATKWTKAADGLSWTFTLRKGVKFSNGQEVTAKDVKWSLDFAREPREDKPWQFLLDNITGVDIVDDSTIKVDLKQPWAPLPSDLAIFASAIMPANFGGKTEQEFRNNPIGTGPYQLDSWKKGDSIKFKKNVNYWDKGRPKLNTLTFKYVPDANTRKQMVQSGQAHVDEFPTAVSVEALKKTKGVSVQSFPSTSLIWVNLNNRKKPLNDIHVRKAMSYAVDKAAIVKAVYYGTAEEANTMLSKNLMGYDKSIKSEYSMDKAKDEMAKSSSPSGFSVTIQVQSGDPEKSQIAQILQNSWKKLGIDVKLQTLDSTTIYSNRKKGDFDIAMFEMTNDVSDPDEWMHYMFASDASVNSGYANSTVDDLIAKAASDDNVDNRKKMYAQVQQILAEEAPEIPLVYKPGLFVVRDGVENFKVTTLGQYDLTQTHLTR